MTNDEQFDRLATAIERVAEAQLATQTQMGFFADQLLRLSQQQSAMQEQQTVILQRQAKQVQRFDSLLGEIRHIVQRLDERFWQPQNNRTGLTGWTQRQFLPRQTPPLGIPGCDPMT